MSIEFLHANISVEFFFGEHQLCSFSDTHGILVNVSFAVVLDAESKVPEITAKNTGRKRSRTSSEAKKEVLDKSGAFKSSRVSDSIGCFVSSNSMRRARSLAVRLSFLFEPIVFFNLYESFAFLAAA